MMAQRNRDNNLDLAVFRRFAMLQRQNQGQIADAVLRRIPLGGFKEPRVDKISVHGKTLTYTEPDGMKVGLYIAAEPLTPQKNYFEIEILDTGILGAIGIGLVPYRYPFEMQPGWSADSIGFHVDDGKLFKANGHGRPFGPRCSIGDRVGCHINFNQSIHVEGAPHTMVPVSFTKNGKEIGTVMTALPPDGLHPAVGMHSEGEEVKLDLNAKWDHSDVTLMSIDSCEEDWSRLHDIRINGQMLEYTGRGKSITDVGLAQARHALTTRNHYYEIQIVDPGENCYIAIGLARRDYPKHRHPGWNRGSIAYHADDGKIFIGSGVGEQFGPECNKGDMMGCGILYPRNYQWEWDAVGDDAGPDALDIQDPTRGDLDLDFPGIVDSESEDEEWWEKPNAEHGTKVQVFFTRNGKTIGKRNVRIPKYGFYPTVGMLSSDEKVRVDLRPLTG